MANPFPVVITSPTGGVLTVTGATSGAFSTAAPFPVTLTDANGNFLSLGSGTSSTPINAMGNTTGAGVSIDLSKGTIVTMTLTGNVTSSSFANAPASAGQEITFIITQDATGGRTFAWPTAIVPALLGPAPTLTASSVSVFKGVVDSSGKVNFITNGPIVVYRQIVTGIVASDATHAIAFTPPVVGNYRVNATLLCTATGAGGATMTIQANAQNANSNSPASNAIGNTSIVRATGATMTAHANDTTSSSGMGYSVVVSGTIGAATYTAELVIEWLGE